MKKKEEVDRKKQIVQAKKKLKKEVEHTKMEVRKHDMETTKCQRAVGHVLKVEESMNSKKIKALEKFDDGLSKVANKHSSGSATLQKKMEVAGTSRGKLLHLEFAARMLETGFIVPTGPEAIEDKKANGVPSIQDKMMDELAVLRDETDALQQEHESLLLELQDSRQQLSEARRSTDAIISSPPPPRPALEPHHEALHHSRVVQVIDGGMYGGALGPYGAYGMQGMPGTVMMPGATHGAYPGGIPGAIQTVQGGMSVVTGSTTILNPTYAGSPTYAGAPTVAPTYAGSPTYAGAPQAVQYRSASPGIYSPAAQASYPYDQAALPAGARYVSPDEYVTAPQRTAAMEERAAAPLAAPMEASGAGLTESSETGPGARAFFKAAHSLTAQALREYRQQHTA